MPRKRPSLHFDRRKGSWVENPKTALQEHNEKPDDYHGGFIVGVVIGGALYTGILALAFIIDLL